MHRSEVLLDGEQAGQIPKLFGERLDGALQLVEGITSPHPVLKLGGWFCRNLKDRGKPQLSDYFFDGVLLVNLARALGEGHGC